MTDDDERALREVVRAAIGFAVGCFVVGAVIGLAIAIVALWVSP